MADEARIQASLQIRKTNTDGDMIILQYQGQPTAFTADVTGTKGPVPGAISVAIGGTAVDFSELTDPGFCRLMNLDETNFVEWGIREPATGYFYPIGEIGPGETYVIKLSRNLLEEYTGSGTATGPATNEFYMKADTAACNVLVEAFER